MPDVLTGLRLICAGVLLVALTQSSWALSLAVLLVGVATDALDGEIVRRWRFSETSYGAAFDQIADTALWIGLFVGLFVVGKLPGA